MDTRTLDAQMSACECARALTTAGTANTPTITTSVPPQLMDKLFPSKTISSQSIYYNNQLFTIKDDNDFKKIEELAPFKVYRFTFNDGKVIKTICDEEDSFNLEYALYLALAKKLYSKTHTFEGVLAKSYTLHYEKYYSKIVKKGLKLFYKQQREEAKKEDEKILRENQHKKYIEKKKARDKRRAIQAQENLQKLIIEAIKVAKEGE